MDPVTSPLIHKDSGHQARARSGRGESPLPLRVLAAHILVWIDHRDVLVTLPSEINNPSDFSAPAGSSQEVCRRAHVPARRRTSSNPGSLRESPRGIFRFDCQDSGRGGTREVEVVGRDRLARPMPMTTTPREGVAAAEARSKESHREWKGAPRPSCDWLRCLLMFRGCFHPGC